MAATTRNGTASERGTGSEGGTDYQDYGPLIRMLKKANLDLFTDRDYLPQCSAENVVVLAHTHCLDSSYYLFRTLVDTIEIPAQNIRILPKSYSTIPAVIRRLHSLGIEVLKPELKPKASYDSCMEPYVEDICRQGHVLATKLALRKRDVRVLLIDDGGVLTRQWLKSQERRSVDTVSIQQTRSGVSVLGETPCIPVINVAQSAAKRKFESHYIARAIIEKTEELKFVRHDRHDRSIGVFGLGMIGRAVAKALLDKGHEIHVCDEQALKHDDEMDYWQELRQASSRKNFVNSCDLIFGATAGDWLRDDYLPRRIGAEKVLISCSSRDREFQYILRRPDSFRVDDEDRFTTSNYYADMIWRPLSRQQPFRLLNGGYPINFDRQKEWERPTEIALTRVLILAAVIQGLCTDLAATRRGYIQLDANIQRDLTLHWLRLCDKTAQDFFLDASRVSELDWWIEKSYGAQPDPCRVVRFPVSRAQKAPRRTLVETMKVLRAAAEAKAEAKAS